MCRDAHARYADRLYAALHPHGQCLFDALAFFLFLLQRAYSLVDFRQVLASMCTKRSMLEELSSTIRIRISGVEVAWRGILYYRRKRCSSSSSRRRCPPGVLHAVSRPSWIQRFKAGSET